MDERKYDFFGTNEFYVWIQNSQKYKLLNRVYNRPLLMYWLLPVAFLAYQYKHQIYMLHFCILVGIFSCNSKSTTSRVLLNVRRDAKSKNADTRGVSCFETHTSDPSKHNSISGIVVNCVSEFPPNWSIVRKPEQQVFSLIYLHISQRSMSRCVALLFGLDRLLSTRNKVRYQLLWASLCTIMKKHLNNLAIPLKRIVNQRAQC